MGQAVGVVIQDVPLPAFFSNVTASATSPDDPGAVLTVVSTNPLQVTSPTLGAGKHVTVQFSADAAPGCSDTTSSTRLRRTPRTRSSRTASLPRDAAP